MKKIYNLYSQVSQAFLSPDLIRFFITGVLSVIIEYSVLIFLTEVSGINYLLSNIVAFIAANIFNYLLSRLWVFGKSKRRIRHEFLLFLATSSIGLLINQIIMWYLVDYHSINYKTAKFFAIVTVVIWNFWSKKFLVFSNQNKHHA